MRRFLGLLCIFMLAAGFAGAQSKSRPGGSSSSGSIGTDDVFNGSVSSSGADFEGYNASQLEVNGFAGERLRLVVESEDFDPYVVLEASNGNRLSDDDNGAGVSSLVEYYFQNDETITVWVRGLSEDDTGDFTVTTELLDNAVPLDVGQSFTVTINNRDPEIRDSNYEEYVFVAEAGRDYEIVAESDTLDTYLLVTTSANQSFTNDDADGTNSMVEFSPLEDGEVVWVKVMPFSSDNGRIELSVDYKRASGSKNR